MIEADWELTTLGTWPYVGTGSLMTEPGVAAVRTLLGAKEDCVAMDDAELVLAGLAGRTMPNGEGDGTTPWELDCRIIAGIDAAFGVGVGEVWAEPEVFSAAGFGTRDANEPV